jgi:hypothetical protein
MASDAQTKRFFALLGGAFGSPYDTEMLETDPVHLGEAPRCDACGRFVGGRPWLPPHRAELTLHGSTWGDFAFRGAVGEDFLIVSPVAARFRESEMTGLSGFESVEIVSFAGSSTPPPDYVHVAVEIGSASIDESRSSLQRSGEVESAKCGHATTLDAVHGFAVASETWRCADVFIALGLPGTPIVSERFKNWAESAQLSNVRFTPTAEFEWDSSAPASASSCSR